MEKVIEGDVNISEEIEKTKVAELEKEEVSQTESKPTIIMTVGDGSTQPGHNMVEIGVAMVSSATAGQHSPSPRVKVKIEYPKGWKKDKHFKDGDIKDIAPEIADQFVALGIASIEPTESE